MNTSLSKMLREEGHDIWEYSDTGFFHAVAKGFYKEAKRGKHIVFKNHTIFGEVANSDRFNHELGHLVCCQDQNVMNPAWDFNHFIDADGQFTTEQTYLEAEVLYVGVLLDMEENKERGDSLEAVYGTMGSLYPYSVVNKITAVPREHIREFLLTKMVYKWTLNTILDEVLRKYELIRSRR